MVGELVQTTAGKCITHPPTRCLNGHALRPDRTLLRTVSCACGDTPLGGAIAVKPSTGLCFPSTAG